MKECDCKDAKEACIILRKIKLKRVNCMCEVCNKIWGLREV